MASSPKASHLTQRQTTLDDPLDVPEPAAATVLPADVQNAEELDYDKTGVVALFKKKK